MSSKRHRRNGGVDRVTRRARADSRIDTSDIAPLDQDFFARAVRNPFSRPLKQSTTVRLDADVLAWLRSQGPGYQTRLNAILRAARLRNAAPTPGLKGDRRRRHL
jgi:uncharacterized protein (DUF4415 family)